MMAPVVESERPLQRHAFRVVLDAGAPAEINFKELVRQQTKHQSQAAKPNVDTVTERLAPPSTSSPSGAVSALALPPAPRTQRYNIIERLEKRYGGGVVVDCSDGGSGGGGGGGFERGEDDDLYDSEDSFIDDTELQQNIEEIHGQTKVQTKHSGFFVNAGDEIETVERDDSDDQDDAPASASNSKRNKKNGSGGAVKAFLDEWSEAATEWQPEPEVVTAMETLHSAVKELAKTTPITKVFPRKLDDALRAVDKLVVESHPNKWRVNGYFATLMTFLPFTKQYLKSNMLRLEVRDVARGARDDIEQALAALSKEIVFYVDRATREPIDSVKQAITQDKDLAVNIHGVLTLQDEWIVKENEYRQMLKTEDKKHMSEADYVPLNARQERNRLLNRIVGVFTTGLMDLQTLRGMNKAAKPKAPRKSVPAKATPKATEAVKRKASPSSTPSVPSTAAVTPATSSAPAKRITRPFKSRMMEDPPVFSERDFEEMS